MAQAYYIEANADAIKQAQAKLKKEHLPGDIDTFINLVNNKIINPNNEDIKEIIRLMTEGYANIASRSSRIYVKSKAETLVEQSLLFLEHYKLATIFKRIAQELLDSEYPQDTKLILSFEHPGSIYLEPTVEGISDEDLIPDTDENGLFKFKDLIAYDGAEKFTGSKNAVPSNLFLMRYLKDYRVNDGTSYIIAGDIAKLSVDPIAKLETFIDETTNEFTK